MNKDGYPDKRELKKIRKWKANDYHGLMAFVHDRWNYAEVSWKQTGDVYYISTVGWSGNEDLIGAMNENYAWWALYWFSVERGGHYVFKGFGAIQ